MGVKLAASFDAEVTMLSHSPSKEADAKKLGAHNFVLTKDESQVKKMSGYFDFILDTVSAEHDYNMYLNLLGTERYNEFVLAHHLHRRKSRRSISFSGEEA